MRKGGFPWPRRQTARFLRHICVRIQPTFWPCCPRPAVRRRAAPAAAKPRWTASPARPTARCAPPKTWPLTPRSAPHRPTRSRCALQRWPRPTSAARRVCAAARCSCPNGLGRLCGPWEMRGCLPPHWVICWPTRCSMAASGPQYPCVRRGAGKRCFSLWPTTARDARPPPGTAAWALGLRLHGACFSLCLPLCPPGAAPSVPDYMADRFSPLYVQLAPVCDLPL